MHFDLTDLGLFLHVAEAGSITADDDGLVAAGLTLVRGIDSCNPRVNADRFALAQLSNQFRETEAMLHARAAGGTVAAAHADDADVEQVLTVAGANHFTLLDGLNRGELRDYALRITAA